MILQSDLLEARNNNFTIVRLVLASSVIYTHSFWLIRGISGVDDLSWFLGAPISVYAVDGFFFLSGFLVYPSLLRLGKVKSFLLARLVRLWPALAASVTLSVIGGLLITNASPGEYFTGPTLRFIGGNLSLLFSAFFLTGVTCGAEPCVINGSLWTLPWEARCYALLALLGAVGLASPKIMARFILPLILVAVIVWDVPAVQKLAASVAGTGAVYHLDLLDRLGALFALGIAAYVFRHKIYLSWYLLAALFVVNLAAHYVGLGLHVRAVFIGYAVLCFGILSARKGSISGAWPDYSYGMYIYAFPIMMGLQALFGFSSYLALAAANALATLPVAALSWHFLEKPALDAFRRARKTAVPKQMLIHP